jgi:hypothetical protein
MCGWDVAFLRKQHNKWLGQFDASLLSAALDIGASAVHFASQSRVIKRRTGELAAGWHRGIQRKRNKITVMLVTRVKHAWFQERGTGIYGPTGLPITPRRAKFLRWKSPTTGNWIFAKSVKGVKPKWIGKNSARGAWGFGEKKLIRGATSLARKF